MHRVFIASCLLATTPALADDDVPSWEALEQTDAWDVVASKTSDVGEVQIRHRRFDDLDCLEGRVLTAGDPEAMVQVAADAESAVEWSSADITAAKALHRDGSSIDYYQYLDVPNWTLVADRYWILRGTILAEGPARRFRWERGVPDARAQPSHDDAKARSSHAIEPPRNKGEWVFTPTGDRVDVRYRACADIGGSIPLWLQKMVAKSTLPDTVTDLVREARKRSARSTP